VIENYLQNVFVLFDILGRMEDALAHFGHPVSCILVGSVLLLILVFCVVLLCVFTFLVPCCDVRCDVWFVFTSSCLYEGSCLIYVTCAWLRI